MKNNKIILDTTYVLPLFGVQIDISPTFLDEVKSIWKTGLIGYQLYLPSPCLIEVIYKLNREFRKNKRSEALDRYSLVLPTVIRSKVVEISQSFLNPTICKTALNIRKAGHRDLMDCMIGATATSLRGLLITEDDELGKIMGKLEETRGTPKFTWKEFHQSVRRSK